MCSLKGYKIGRATPIQTEYSSKRASNHLYLCLHLLPLLADPLIMKTIIHNGHRIEAPGSTLTGIEKIRYDGEIVSTKRSVLGATHTFQANEGGEIVEYEVIIGTRWLFLTATCTIRREGELLFTDC